MAHDLARLLMTGLALLLLGGLTICVLAALIADWAWSLGVLLFAVLLLLAVT